MTLVHFERNVIFGKYYLLYWQTEKKPTWIWKKGKNKVRPKSCLHFAKKT
jgi:hypothetical protein